MPASRPLLLTAVLLALTPSAALAQTTDDPPAADDAAAATAPPVDAPCDAQCEADAATAPDDDTADDPDTGDEPVDDSDAADDDGDGSDADDAPPAPGTLDAALDDGWVTAGSFRAPTAGRLRVVLVATPGAAGPVLGRASFTARRRSTIALRVHLTAAGTRALGAAEDDLTLVARTSWTAKGGHHVRTRTAERRVQLPMG